MSEAFQIHGADRPGQWLITCDHATNRVPLWVNDGNLGIALEDMARHIAFDPGAAGVTLALAQALNTPAILSDFSRLVIDANRAEDDPTLVMRLYDGTIIPANRAITPQQIEERLNRLHRPYHAALEQMADGRTLIAIHSFTPCLRARAPRPWHIGILHSHLDSGFSRALIARLRQEPDLIVGDNEPYNGHLPGDSIDRHALAKGRQNTLIELRNDLIQTAEQQAVWAERLAGMLSDIE
jgi:predicted N-formylglutamate amidohydrolase